MNALATAALSFTICTALPNCLVAQEQLKDKDLRHWPPPLNMSSQGGTVAGLLNPVFRDHAEVCGLITSKVRDDPNRLFVPREVVRNITDAVFFGPAESADVSGGNLALYIYTDAERNVVLSRPSQDRMLIVRLAGSATPLLLAPETGFNALQTTRSCSGYAGGTFQASSPVPAIVGSIATKANARFAGTATVIAGHFRSPLDSLFTSGGWLGLYEKLQLWERYAKDPALIGHAWYMREFEGVMARRDEHTSFDFDSNISVKGSVAVVNASIAAGYTRGGVFDATAWKTIIYSDLSNLPQRLSRFSAAPSVDDISTSLGDAAELVATDPMRQQVEYAFSYSVRGVPQSICMGHWNVDVTSPNLFKTTPRPRVDGSYSEPNTADGNVPLCVFTIRAMPEDALFSQIARPWPFTGRIHTQDVTMPGNPGAKYALGFDVSANLRTSREPTPKYDSAPYSAVPQPAGPGRFVPTWQIALDFSRNTVEPVVQTAGTQFNVVAAGSKDNKFVCAGQSYTLAYTGEVRSDGKYLITITAGDLPYSEYDVSKQEDVCTVELTATVPLQRAPANRERDIPLAVRLAVPQKKPQERAAGTTGTPAPVNPPAVTPPPPPAPPPPGGGIPRN